MRSGSHLAFLSIVWLGCNEAAETPDAAGDPVDTGFDSGFDSGPSDSGSDGGSNDGGDDPLDLCPAGAQLRHFSMTPSSPLPSLSEIDLPTLPNNPMIVSADTGLEQSVRFDVCDSGGQLTLAGVLYLSDSFAGARNYIRDETISTPREEFIEREEGWVLEHRIPPSSYLVEGLAEAVQGDLRSFRVRLAVDSGLLMMGHDGFIAFGIGNVTSTSIQYTSIYIVVGGLSEGDVFAGMECRFGEQPLTTSFSLATATFEIEACTFLGGGFTTGYEISYLAVTDTSAELTEAERQRHEFTGKENVRAVMNYAWNHHNACDSFHLALPHADYAASAAPAAGCGETVPNAPPRDFNEPPGAPVFFRIRYHGGEWVDGEIPGCAHYLFCAR